MPTVEESKRRCCKEATSDVYKRPTKLIHLSPSMTYHLLMSSHRKSSRRLILILETNSFKLDEHTKSLLLNSFSSTLLKPLL